MGDCWLLGALQSLSVKDLKKLVYFDGLEFGFCVIQIYFRSEWKSIMVDTRIPCFKDRPAYGRNTDSRQFLVAMIEKAFSKSRGSYESLNGGNTAEAMVDLTGGISKKINLNAATVDDLFWRMLKSELDAKNLIGCAYIKRN